MRFAGAFHKGFETRFARFHRGYVGLLHVALRRRIVTSLVTLGVLVLGGTLFLFTGQDYFPEIESSQMTMHLRARAGLRIETTQQVFAQVQDVVREVIPENEIEQVLDNIGVPSINYNFAFSDGSFVSYNDGQMLISLKEGMGGRGLQKASAGGADAALPRPHGLFPARRHHHSDPEFRCHHTDRRADLGAQPEKNLEVAQTIVRRLRETKGLVDVHLQQIVNVPQFYVDVDRRLASELGLTEQAVAQNMNISLSGSYQVTPNFWPDPKTGIPYQLWCRRRNTATPLSPTCATRRSSSAPPPPTDRAPVCSPCCRASPTCAGCRRRR